MELRGKNVVITGASSGIGRATALEMARRGANVVLAARFSSIPEANPDEVRELIETNYLGAFHCTQAVLPRMLAKRSGAIVNVSSITGLMGYSRMSAYCASKFALTGFTEALRDEVAGSGVRVALVCPGTTETEFFVRAERGKMPGASRLLPSVGPERVARAVCDAAEDGRYRRILPLMAAIYMRFKEFSPRLAHAMFRWVSSLLERKGTAHK
jgi:short-subunit dehydrogenase